MSVYVDLKTGTWGDASELVLVDMTDTDQLDDDDILSYAEAHGTPVLLPTSR